MAATIKVAGPTVIRCKGGALGNYTILGYSDNDNLPSFQFNDTQHEIKTVLSGAVPEEIVLTGTSARISVALVKWDETTLDAITALQRGATNSTTIGKRLVATSSTFEVQIEATMTGEIYTFGRCYLPSDSIGDSQWGNRERVLTIAFMAIPNSSNNLYTYSA